MKLISLNHGKFSKVDDDDFERLSQWKWSLTSREYARRRYRKNGKGVQKYMHREILNPPDGVEIDHINGDKLDNRKSNLRECNRVQNMHNTGIQINNTSGYKGVCWNKSNHKWIVQLIVRGVRMYLGTYSDIIEAAKRYDEVSKEYFGEFTRPNFE